MFIKMIMVQSINGVVNQKDRKKWNSTEDFDYLKSEIEKSDSLIISRETFILNKKLYQSKPCLVLNKHFEKIEGYLTYSIYSKKNITNFIKKNKYERTLLLGGPTINTFLLNDNLIDEISLTIEPVAFNGKKNIFNNENIKDKKFFTIKEIKRINQNSFLIVYAKKSSL